MPVIASTYFADGYAQPDGSRYVCESHTLSDGSVRNVMRIARPGDDLDAALAANAARIDAEIAAEEIQAALNG